MHPYCRQGEIRFDETNPQPSGIPGFTTGRLFNGRWLYANAHVGWNTIFEHDWARNRTPEGRPLGAVRPRPLTTPRSHENPRHFPWPAA